MRLFKWVVFIVVSFVLVGGAPAPPPEPTPGVPVGAGLLSKAVAVAALAGSALWTMTRRK